MKMKMPNCPVGSGYCGNGDSYESDPEDYATPPNEEIAPNYDEDFSEYMWMENEEEFDKMEMQRLEEEALMEQCIEAMLEDELEQQEADRNDDTMLSDQECLEKDICNVLAALEVNKQNVDIANSTLNPLAAEFVPSMPLVPPA